MHRQALLLLAISAFSSCDIVDSPKGELATPTPPPGNTVTRNVLLEDCTGFRCNNCPDAAVRAMQLKSIYGDRLVVVGVHMTTTFAQPVEPLDDNWYDTDFRTEAGNAYETTFGIDALPKGMVNRKVIDGTRAISRYTWASAVAGMIDQEAAVDLKIRDLNYDGAANTISGTVTGVVRQPLSTAHNITLYITEDHVIDWQLNNQANPPDVPDYEHRHVLRGALNSPWGQPFLAAGPAVGDTVELAFSFGMPTNVLVPSNCALVAYVYSTEGADQYEVKQVVEEALVP
ncbi:MAG: Omp28-related outer membrane protein [Flavobacteriales bacterium]|nr:Omp28-related outer membrane protein [Flavobacteriales bacterium]MEB2340461.1 Omp28-related outer membrane protein [Flavobacteriia bacterium]